MKQPVVFNFGKGLDTKSDPWQIAIGNFLRLENSVFSTLNQLKKRNGYANFTELPQGASFLTTFNNNLTAIGSSVQAYSSGTNTWVNKGNLQPVSLRTLPLIRSNTNQSQVDAAVAPNGLVCTVYTDQNTASLATSVYKYAIADSITGQNIVSPTLIPASGGGAITGSPRVFVLGSYFIIVFTNVISSTSHLQYIAISTNNPSITKTNTDIAAAYDSSPRLSWDGVVVGENLYVAYNTSAGGQAIKIAYLTSTLSLASAVTYSNSGKVTATIMSLTADTSGTGPIIYATYYDSGSSTGYAFAVDQNLNKIISTPAEWIASGTIDNVSTVASNKILTIYYEVANNYGYDNTIPTNYLKTNTVTQAGSVGSASVLVRSVGLASKAFISNGNYYFLAAYQSIFQPTYFLMNGTGQVVSKLAYSNGGGYDSLGTPSVTVSGSNAQIAYLFKDFVTSQNTSSTESITKSNIYSQTGLNLVTFNIGASAVVPAEIGQALHLSGGFLWEYDGYQPVEHNFYLWPDSVEGTPANSGGSMVPQEYQYQAVYTWADNQGNVHYSAPSIPIVVDMSSSNTSFTQPSALTPVGSGTNGTKVITIADAAYTFTVTSASATSGATYTNHGHTFTVVSTISSATTLVCTGISPLASGTLTKTGGTGDSTITFSAVKWAIAAGQIITDTTNPTYIQAGTYITSAGNGVSSVVVNISLILLGSPSGDTFSIASICSAIINIPTLRLTYKISNPVKIELFRWSAGQQEFFQCTTIQTPLLNDITIDYVSFADTLADNQIVGNSLIYTTGGVVEDIGAPSFNSITLFDDRLWGIDAEDPNLLWYSKQVIEATPVEMSDLFTLYVPPSTAAQGSTGNMKCIFPMDDKLIIFKANAIYYINGTGPDNTGANSQYSNPIFVTSTVGTIIQQSIVMTDNGIMFQSDKGYWLLQRSAQQCAYLGAAVEEFTLEGLANSAIAIPETTQVRSTMSNGITLMMDYFNNNQWGTFTGVPAVSSTIYNNFHTYIDQCGDVFQETPGNYLDGTNPVLLAFQTGWINLAGISGYQRIHEIIFLGQFQSPANLVVSIAYDFREPTQQSIITPNNYTGIYGSDALYGQTSPFGGIGPVLQWRVQLQTQKCQTFQITMQEQYDPSYGVKAGAGFTLSGITGVITLKKGYKPIKSANTVG